MSDQETPGRAGAWTEEAKCQFLLHIIAQLKGDNNKAISWNKINMPGRTTKSLQNMWTKINKTISEMEAANANGEEIPKAIPRKRGPPKAKAVKAEPEDDDDEEQKVTPLKSRKRGSTVTPKSAKKMKTEDSEDEGYDG